MKTEFDGRDGDGEKGLSGGDEDAHLFAAYCLDGNARSFNAVYERHADGLFRAIRRLVKSDEIANDLFQKTWTKLLNQRKIYQATAPLGAYLRLIARGIISDYFRGVRNAPEKEELDADGTILERLAAPGPTPEEQALSSEMTRRFEHCLDQLPEHQRLAFVTKELRPLRSWNDVAEALGLKLEAARARHLAAWNKMVRCMGDLCPIR